MAESESNAYSDRVVLLGGIRGVGTLGLGIVLLLVGCDDPSGPAGGGATAGAASEGGETTSAADGEAADGEAGSGETEADTLGINHADPCETLTDEAACAERPDCMYVIGDWRADASCSLGVPNRACLEAGEAIAADYRTTYYRADGSGFDYLFNGAPCVHTPGQSARLPAVPVGWTECSGAPGEPERCDCWCGGDVCPREEGFLTLEACGVSSPCGEVVDQEYGEAFGAYTQCVFEALRDRTPGRFALNLSDALFYDRTIVYADGSGQVQVLDRGLPDTCSSLTLDTWGPARSCTLQPPQFFDDCLAASPLAQSTSCSFSRTWFTDCQDVAPVCP